QLGVDVGLADDLEGQRLALGLAVAVRREHELCRRGRVDTGVHQGQRLLDGPLSAWIRRPIEQVPVEGHRARAARVEPRPRYGAEPHERLRELEVRQPTL